MIDPGLPTASHGSIARKTCFCEPIQSDRTVCFKIRKFIFRFSENCAYLCASRSLRRGASANRHERWGRDAMDARCARDERCRCGRRNRVVLTPRRWRQALGDDPRATVAKKPGTPGRARISRKTIAQGMSVCFDVPVVTNACAFYQCTRGCGCARHPAFPTPSSFRKARGFKHNSGAFASRDQFFSSLRVGTGVKKPTRVG